jgi:hypothetical protein
MFRVRVLALLVMGGGASAWMVGCGADPGDAPKSGDGLIPSPRDAASAAPGNAEADAPDGQGGGGGDPIDAGAVAVADSAASDSPGEGGSPDVGSSDGPAPDAPAGSTCTLCPLVAKYMTATTGATPDIAVHVEIANSGTSDEDLAALTLRYWFTADGSLSQVFACDYAVVGCGSVQAKFVTMAAPVAAADHYLELSFTAGTVAAGTGTGEIQARFHDANYAVTFTQTNDYSFNAAYAAYAPWNQITLYRGGTLVFGVEP